MATAVSKLANRDKVTAAAAALFAGSVDVIPERYVRADEVREEIVVADSESFELPVVDMARLLDPEFSVEEAEKLGSSCFDWGFFQLTNHGIHEELIQRIKDNTVEFFNLPLVKKNAVAISENGIDGFGHHFNRSSDDRLDWAETLILRLQPTREMEMWPTEPTTFRDTLDKYSEEMASMARKLLVSMAGDLGVDRERLLGTIRGQRQSVAFHHYPPCRHPEKVIGITPHSDCFGMTLLLPVDDTPGLQIKKDGRWFPVRPLPGAFIVNIGDSLEILTNGRYRSVEHRVVVNSDKGRMTVATVFAASHEGMIGPIPELVREGKTQYKSVESLEYVKGFLGAVGEATRYIETMKES